MESLSLEYKKTKFIKIKQLIKVTEKAGCRKYKDKERLNENGIYCRGLMPKQVWFAWGISPNLLMFHCLHKLGFSFVQCKLQRRTVSIFRHSFVCEMGAHAKKTCVWLFLLLFVYTNSEYKVDCLSFLHCFRLMEKSFVIALLLWSPKRSNYKWILPFWRKF